MMSMKKKYLVSNEKNDDEICDRCGDVQDLMQAFYEENGVDWSEVMKDMTMTPEEYEEMMTTGKQIDPCKNGRSASTLFLDSRFCHAYEAMLLKRFKIRPQQYQDYVCD